ncbi:BirA family transcriptional regulator, biotin operon repressor / biotin-[acetyl-CoA-carboxylase] ligase [Gracilibacillus orientalis]|uniref:Bifunctional ligase/repressor BirA n=1 Tax=Gracilibacillus orientalis TaxID=334253 RepID=A0A1I4L391_9BACI|nr:biotin--[acetyl-CoA-carboxylase] ligase [Gracilibacillus orientalis]SFL85482.1 BirA family transcriptional regulator, biotin operon repressor / biotin-[acetyl-CoA-carboxylase] ligase [Gracilibacillus orientalis]
MTTNKRHELISLLAGQDDHYISGQALSEKLEVSRTAIWKHMNELKKDGYQFESVPKKGYRLIAKPDKLNESTIKWGLDTDWLGKRIEFRHEVASTQDLAHALARKGAEHGTVVTTNKQLSGRGRMDRRWVSDHDGGIWMSLILRPNIPPHQASHMTLFVAVTLVDTLERVTGQRIQIKWPNDLFIDGKKISGILTEMSAELEAIQYLIIGFGINVNQSSEDFPEDLEAKSTSLGIESGQEWDRQAIIQNILQDFEIAYQLYLKTGFGPIKEKWLEHAYKLNEKIHVKTAQEEYAAIVKGITDDGALIVLNDKNEEKVIYSAEIIW